VRHEFIEEFKGLTKDQIYDNSLRWIAQNFKSAKQVIDFQDRTNGTIVAKGNIPEAISWGVYNGALGFTLTIDAKDGKARFQYTNVLALTASGREFDALTGKELLHTQAQQEFIKLTSRIHSGVTSPDNSF
jgi:hypothetical protein